MNLLEFIQKEIITTINGRVDETAKRDYKKEYEKYGKSEKAKKYRAELNKYNRDKGTYGNGDGKDASHKGGKIVGFESEKKNRGRAEKSRLKKEHHGDDFPKELLSGSLSDILDKLSKIDKEDYNDVEDILKKHFKNDEVVESLLEKCWKGYKIHPKRKTKKLFGKTYPNCVKNEAQKKYKKQPNAKAINIVDLYSLHRLTDILKDMGIYNEKNLPSLEKFHSEWLVRNDKWIKQIEKIGQLNK